MKSQGYKYELSDLFRYGQNESQDDVNTTVMRAIYEINKAELTPLAVKVVLILLSGIKDEMEDIETDG